MKIPLVLVLLLLLLYVCVVPGGFAATVQISDTCTLDNIEAIDLELYYSDWLEFDNMSPSSLGWVIIHNDIGKEKVSAGTPFPQTPPQGMGAILIVGIGPEYGLSHGDKLIDISFDQPVTENDLVIGWSRASVVKSRIPWTTRKYEDLDIWEIIPDPSEVISSVLPHHKLATTWGKVKS